MIRYNFDSRCKDESYRKEIGGERVYYYIMGEDAIFPHGEEVEEILKKKFPNDVLTVRGGGLKRFAWHARSDGHETSCLEILLSDNGNTKIEFELLNYLEGLTIPIRQVCKAEIMFHKTRIYGG